MSIQNIIGKLFAELTADTGASGIAHASACGSRIYPIEGRHGSDFPHLSFWALPSTPTHYMGGAISIDLLVQFDIFADKRSGADAANDVETKLYALLESKTLTSTPTGFDRAVCTFNSRGGQIVEEDAIRITDEVRIQATDF